jgi:hypothetical protein
MIRILYNIRFCFFGYSIYNFKFKYLDNLFQDVYYIHVINEKQDPTVLYKTRVL